MSIESKIDEIRSKPEYVRVRYAWGLSIGITLLVVVLWIMSLGVQEDEVSTQSILGEEQMNTLDEIKAEGNNLQETARDIKNSVETQAKQKPQNESPSDQGARNNNFSDRNTSGNNGIIDAGQ